MEGEEELGIFDAPEVAHITKWLVRDAEKPAKPEQIASCAFDFSSKLAASSTANPPAEWRTGLVAEHAERNRPADMAQKSNNLMATLPK